jgi:hypothetical protein
MKIGIIPRAILNHFLLSHLLIRRKHLQIRDMNGLRLGVEKIVEG